MRHTIDEATSKATRSARGLLSVCVVGALALAPEPVPAPALSGAAPAREVERRGTARADAARPEHFPHRIWAACDFEGRTPDYGWFGSAETRDVPGYPGNRTALRGAAYGDRFAFHAGIDPVPGPRMGKHNKLYIRYKLSGATEARFQHFNLTCGDNHHIVVSGLKEGAWSELTLDFTRDSRRNDSSPGAMSEGDRMGDLKVLLGCKGDGKRYELLIDDVLLFVEDPGLPPDPEPFPRRVIGLWGFDTGERERHWPGDLEIAERPPEGASWRAARAVQREDGVGKWIRLAIAPPRPVGERTRLRFRYHLAGADALTVQIFDRTVMDNRHVRLTGLAEGAWRDAKVDFTRNSRRNDGSEGPFAAGDLVDDLFFFLEAGGGRDAELYIDEVVLYDGQEEAR